jgi:hypothetical protein
MIEVEFYKITPHKKGKCNKFTMDSTPILKRWLKEEIKPVTKVKCK